MNVGNILLVADAIEQASVPGLGFNMANWVCRADEETPDRSGRGCGTVACIAGWAAIVATGKEDVGSPWDVATEFLGLVESQPGDLFIPVYDSRSERHAMTDATPVEAVRVLRKPRHHRQGGLGSGNEGR